MSPVCLSFLVSAIVTFYLTTVGYKVNQLSCIVMQEASDAHSKTADSDTVSTYQVSSVQLVTDNFVFTAYCESTLVSRFDSNLGSQITYSFSDASIGEIAYSEEQCPNTGSSSCLNSRAVLC